MNPEIANHDVLKNEPTQVEQSYAAEELNGSSPFLLSRGPSTGADLMLALWRERRFVVKALALGMVLAAIVSLLMTPLYESTTRVMPPEKRGLGGLAAMLAAAGEDKAGSVVGGLVSDAMGIKSSGALYIGVLKSDAVEDAVISQFDLRKEYRVSHLKDARETLAQNTDINEDRKSGIISVTVTDRSPQRAAQMAAAYITILNQLMAQLDTSASHRERVFLEDRLKTVKQDLDAASKELSDFSSKNLTLDVKEQGKAMLEGVASLEGELIATESQLSGLEQIYTPNNVRVRSLQARVAVLKQKLAQLQGNDAASSDLSDDPDGGISISRLPVLGLTYSDLYRRAKIEETVFEVLTKQYELAKIDEAKELPTIKVLDPALVPETKSSPKRTLMTLFGGLLAAVLAACYVMMKRQLRIMSTSGPLSLFGLEVREGLGEDWAFLRSHTPEPVLRLVSRLRERLASRSAGSSTSE